MPNDAVWVLNFLAISQCLLLFANGHSAILLPSQLGRESPPSCPAPNPDLYYRPVIGIVSHPGDGASGRLSNATGASYIAASYVKFVEAAGARVVPLIYNEPPEKLLKKLELVNGVLFTGGWAKNGLYFETVGKIFQKVLEKNDAGDHFPLYAVCLGFELITMIISQDNNILEEFSASNQASTLQFVENANFNGTVFQRFPPDLLRKMSTECLVMQNHRVYDGTLPGAVLHCYELLDPLGDLGTYGSTITVYQLTGENTGYVTLIKYGISSGKLLDNQKLTNFFEILTTCTDEDDRVYVSTVRSRNYPVTGFQWHPEKNAFEWASPRIPHTEDAIQITQYAANFLVSEARKSLNRPVAQELLDNLIYNYSPTYCGKAGRGFDEVYIFAPV